MGTKEQTIEKWRAYMAKKADVQMYRTALTGDGSSAPTCDVEGKPGWAWVRYDEKQDKASQVVNQVMPGAPQGVPVIIGKKYPHDKYYQILGINMELYYEHVSPTEYISYLLPLHGSTHLSSGNDPAWIDAGNFVPGAISATFPPSLFVRANSLLYEWGGNAQTLASSTLDLTACVPSSSGTHRYVLITIDPATNSLCSIAGSPTSLPVTPPIPTLPTIHLPLAIVMLEYGDTAITQSDIYQYKYLFGSAGYLYWLNKIAGDYSNELDIELTRHEVGA